MESTKYKKDKRALRQRRIRAHISGTAKRPRLSVFRSGKHIYAQLIDDATSTTLATIASVSIKESGAKTAKSTLVGTAIAEKANKLGITTVVFDRGGYKYHGRVKALAEAARAGGLKF